MQVMRRYISIVIGLCWLTSFSYCAAPMGQGNRDLILCSSLGFDRSPCSLEWWQYTPKWQWGDYRYLRMTNETWTDVDVARLFGGSEYYLFASVDNHIGYSAVAYWLMDEYGGLQGEGLLLPNEPWRHYAGVTACDLDKDGIPEILAVATNRKGQRGIIRFKKDHKNKPPKEKMIFKLKSRVSGLASLANNANTTDVFVACPGSKKRGGRIIRLRISAKGTLLSVAPSFVSIAPELGELGGVGCQLDQDQKTVRMVLCTHDWGKEESNKRTHVAHKADTGFILPSWDIELINSRLYWAEYTKNKKPGKLVKLDSIKARRWTGVAFTPSPMQQTNVSKTRRHKGGGGILQLCGLFHNSYGVEAIAERLNMKLDRYYVKQFQQKCSIPGYDFDDLFKYDVMFVTNVPLWALGGRGVRAIQAYVQGGGTLVFCDGPFAGKVGGYSGSPIEDILPVEIHGNKFEVVPADQLSTDREYIDLSGTNPVYYLSARQCKPDAQSIAWVDDKTIVAKWQLGAGHVIYAGCIPLTESKSSPFSVWNSLNWSKMLGGCVKSLIEE